jgi:hypothetical protein
VFPDVIAESAFCSLVACYPASSAQIAELRETIMDTVHEWMTGICPYEKKWIKWENGGNIFAH